jgi:phosphatidylserine/phosphatidylglycerophosphate/cardiolipin synthase-like enzyme
VTYDADVVSGLRRLMAADRDGQPFPDRLTPRLIIGPERARAQLTELIESATSRIRIVDAKLSDSDLTARLNAKRDAGVAIDVFSAKRIGDLKSHGKVLLVDDRIAVVGSLALAALSLDFRREVAIAVDDPDAVAEVGRFFDTIASTVSNDTAGPIETIGQPRC